MGPEELKDRSIGIDSIRRAVPVVRRHTRPTALHHYVGLSRIIGANVFVKHENHNVTGTFKIRGGLNVLHHLAAAGAPGVITFSTGNHGTSVATAAREYGLPAVVVVPAGSNPAKTRSIMDAGAELIESGTTFEEAAKRADQLQAERNLYYVHPADEPELVNGVGTCFLEVVEQLPEIDVLIAPLGAGSEIASAITVFDSLKPSVQVIAVQAEASQAAYRAWKSGEPCSAANTTFAGGFATGTTYSTTYQLYRDRLADFYLLSEDELIQGMAMALHYTHNLAEAAGAAPIMAAWKHRDRIRGKNVVLQMSGAKAESEQLALAIARNPAP